MITALVVSITYFYYNWSFFKYAGAVMEVTRVKTSYILCTFTVNYLVFYLCSVARWHLIVNWCVFFVFLLAEVWLLNRENSLKITTVALSGVLVGLAINIFLRNTLSVILEVPLSAFDNRVGVPGNVKEYPVSLGFAIAGLWFRMTTLKSRESKLREILEDKRNLRFLFILMLVMYGYLCMNLLVYYTPGDSVVLKVWGIKSSIVVLFGFYLALMLAYKMSHLDRLRTENYQTRLKLEEGKMKAEKLHSMAYHDPLTGCGNRQHAIEMLTKVLKSDQPFCICFIDLDKLKLVNDIWGHLTGDQYILEVVKQVRRYSRRNRDVLFRYGGDEFILLLYNVKPIAAQERIKHIQAKLEEESHSSEFPYAMSVSVGIVSSTEFGDVDKMIHEADRRMYEEKMKMREERGL